MQNKPGQHLPPETCQVSSLTVVAWVAVSTWCRADSGLRNSDRQVNIRRFYKGLVAGTGSSLHRRSQLPESCLDLLLEACKSLSLQ